MDNPANIRNMSVIAHGEYQTYYLYQLGKR